MTPRLLLPFIALGLALAARADEPAIIAKARAYLGSEQALDSVRSLHFVGKITGPPPADPAKPEPGHILSAQVDIIFQKPWQQRLTVNNGQIIRVIALDDYDVWQQLQDAQNLARSRVTILPQDMIRRIRADIWENLAYFRGADEAGVRIEDQGPATVDGVACEKVGLIHAGGVTYVRYFELATGRLVLSETGSGMKIRQEGEILAGGLRFPKRLVQTRAGEGGKQDTTYYEFDRITVNETFPSSLFAVPPPTPLAPPAPAPAAKP